MTEDDVKRIVLSLKGCLDPSHIACGKCTPGYDERERERNRQLHDKLMMAAGFRSGCLPDTSSVEPK
jgi:hypothetical protein